MAALDLSNDLVKAEEDYPKKFNFIAIGLANLDYEDFVKNNFFKGNIYIDETKETYKALGFGVMGMTSLFGMANPMMYYKSFQATRRGITGNLKGDGTQLGGTIIVNKEGDIIYNHSQSNYSDEPNSKEIIEVIKNYTI